MDSYEVIKSGKLLWKNFVSPSREVLEELQKKYGFHELDLEDCLSRTEVPKLEEYTDYVFIVFHFPIKDPETNHIVIISLNVFIGSQFLITISNGTLKRLNDFFENLKEKKIETRKIFKEGSGYLLYLLMEELFSSYNIYINQLNKAIREIEDDIFEGTVLKDRLYDIMMVKRQVITLKRSLTPLAPIVLTLEKLHKRFINKTLELYFDNVRDKVTRGENHLVSINEMIETLHNSNESLTSHNTNRVMKILTIFSVTMLPLNLLTGVFGMNVDLPLSERQEAFLIILAIMAIIFIITMVFFKIKKYL